MTARSRIVGWLVAGSAVVLLAGCAGGDGPGRDDAPSGSGVSATSSESGSAEPQVTAEEVRRSLAIVDPCALLARPSGNRIAATATYAEGPHTCNGTLHGARITVEVGVPFDEAARATAQSRSISRLAAYRDPDRCRMVFAAGRTHGIAVRENSAGCESLDQATDLVGFALSGDIDKVRRPVGTDHFTACELLAGAVGSPSPITDRQGSTAAGLDHCETVDQPVSSRDSLDLTYRSWSFERLTRQLSAAAEKVSGHDVAIVDRGRYGCHVHTYLWQTRTDEPGKVHAEATIFASNCDRARSLAAAVIPAADKKPPLGGDPADLVRHS